MSESQISCVQVNEARGGSPDNHILIANEATLPADGHFLPLEGTNDVAWRLISCDSLATYEAYRARLKSDPEARANFAFAQSKCLVLREERTFLEAVG